MQNQLQVITKLSLFDKYYNLGLKAVNEIYEQYKNKNIETDNFYVTQKTLETLGINNLEEGELNSIKVSIPKYRYRYRDLNGNLLRLSDINYVELSEAVKLGTVIREPKFHKYNYLKLYLVSLKGIDLSRYDLDKDRLLRELDCGTLDDLYKDLRDKYKFKCITDIKNYLNHNWDKEIVKEEETVHLINLLSKIVERSQFIDIQEEFLEERVVRLVCDCNALELRERMIQIQGE